MQNVILTGASGMIGKLILQKCLEDPRVLFKPLQFIYPNIGITSTQLANKIFEIGMSKNTQIIFENEALRQ